MLNMHRSLVAISLILIGNIALAVSTLNDFQPANQVAMPPPAIQQAKVIQPNKRQLIHLSTSGKIISGSYAVRRANKRSIVQPTSADAMNSIIVFPYQPGDLYAIYASPLNVTDVEFQPGEEIISVASGDTMRWEVSKTVSGVDSSRVEHLLIKPMDTDLNTTMVVTTNWRTYHILLKSTSNTFMAAVQWQYDNDGTMMNNLGGNSSAGSSDSNLPVNLSHLDFSYKMKLVQGDKPDWLPTTVFNDGTKTYIEFPKNIQSAPTLFIKQSDSGDAAVNYRVVGSYYVVDQVFTSAELVSSNGQTVVDIYYGK